MSLCEKMVFKLMKNSYGKFSYLYEEFWSKRYAEAFLKTRDIFIEEEARSAGSILDLCCGSGEALRLLSNYNRRASLFGVDISTELVEMARQKVPEAVLQCADIASVEALSDVSNLDLVISLNDSLNHLKDIACLSSVLRKVFQVMTDGGVFFFDLNTEIKYKYNWKHSFMISNDDVVAFIKTDMINEKLASFVCYWFSRVAQDMWTRDEIELNQTWFPVVDVLSCLYEVGFTEVSLFGAGGRPFEGDSDERIYIKAIKG